MRYALALATLWAAGLALAAEDKDGFVPMFNGKNLSGWEARGYKSAEKDHWTVKDGVLSAKTGSGWLGTTKTYGDFVLRLEWRVPQNGNSGIYIRVPDIKTDKLPTFTGMEVQILDDNGPEYKGKLKPWQYSGSLYGVVPAGKSVYKGAGEWNRFEITCRGDRVRIVFNGEKVAEADMAKEPELAKRPRKGFIGLQNHGSAVEFRNVEIKVLDAEPAKP
jgi:hypothetical protein